MSIIYLCFLKRFVPNNLDLDVNKYDTLIQPIRNYIQLLQDWLLWIEFLIELKQDISSYFAIKYLKHEQFYHLNVIKKNFNVFLQHVQSLCKKSYLTVRQVQPNVHQFMFLNNYLEILFRDEDIDIVVRNNLEPNKKCLVVKNFFVFFSNVVKHFNKLKLIHDITSIEIYAYDTIFIDSNFNYQKTDFQLVIIALKWVMIGRRNITLIGDDQVKLETNKSYEVCDFLTNKTCQKVYQGKPGLPGFPSGRFLGLTRTMVNGDLLTIKLIGGIGGDGEDGGKGIDGQNGLITLPPDPQFDLLSSFNTCVLKEISGDQFFNKSTSFYNGDLVRHKGWIIKATPGFKGGNGGCGGSGGIAGAIIMKTNQKNNKFVIQKIKGRDGYGGMGGDGGNGGINNYSIIYCHNRSLTKYYTLESYQIGSAAADGPKGTNGSNKNTHGEKPNESVPLKVSLHVELMKFYLKNNLNHPLYYKTFLEFMQMLDSFTEKLDNRFVANFFNEFILIEQQFSKINYKIDLYSIYNYTLQRMEKNMKNADEELSFLRSAILIKMNFLKHSETELLVPDILSYLNKIIQISEVEQSSKRLVAFYIQTQVNTQFMKDRLKQINSMIDIMIKTDIEQNILNLIKKLNRIVVRIREAKLETEWGIKQIKIFQFQILIYQVLQLSLSIINSIFLLSKSSNFAKFSYLYIIDSALVIPQIILDTKKESVINYLPFQRKFKHCTTLYQNIIIGKLENVTFALNQFINFDYTHASSTEFKTKSLTFFKNISDYYEQLTKIIQGNVTFESQAEGLKLERQILELFTMPLYKQLMQLSMPFTINSIKFLNNARVLQIDSLGNINNFYVKTFLDTKSSIQLFQTFLFNKFEFVVNDTIPETSLYNAQVESEIFLLHLDIKKNIIESEITNLITMMEKSLNELKNQLKFRGSKTVPTDLFDDNFKEKYEKLKNNINDFISHLDVYIKKQLKTIVEKTLDTLQKIILNMAFINKMGNDMNAAFKYFEVNVERLAMVTKDNVDLQPMIPMLEPIFLTNALEWQYRNAIIQFKLWVFPFGDQFLSKMRKFDDLKDFTAENYKIDIVKAHYRRIEMLKAKIEEYRLEAEVGFNQQIFVSIFESGISPTVEPFYVWDNATYHLSIAQLLSGQTILMFANINEYKPLKFAIKLKTVYLKFSLIDNVDWQSFDNLLNRLTIRLTHTGSSYYSCDGIVYLLSSTNYTIEYSYKKQVNGEPVYYNQNYEQLKTGNIMLSPFALWEITLIDNYKTNTFDKLSEFAMNINLELIGFGFFLRDPNICKNAYQHYQDYEIINHENTAIQMKISERSVFRTCLPLCDIFSIFNLMSSKRTFDVNFGQI